MQNDQLKKAHKKANSIAIKFEIGSLLAFPSKGDSRVLLKESVDTTDETVERAWLFVVVSKGFVFNSLVVLSIR